MQPLRVLSAGAAQSVAEQTAERFTRETGCEVKADYGAVGAMKARIVAGEPFDVVILSGQLIEDLVASGHVAPGSRRDLGLVGTGVAVRTGAPLPAVSDARSLRGNLLAATRIVCPDPAVATAGKIVMRSLELLGISRQVGDRVQFFPNGYAAMHFLAGSSGSLDLGITQNTEILANKGVTYAGPLPDELQMKTVYAAGLACRAHDSAAAENFIARFNAPSARSILERAGYEFKD